MLSKDDGKKQSRPTSKELSSTMPMWAATTDWRKRIWS